MTGPDRPRAKVGRRLAERIDGMAPPDPVEVVIELAGDAPAVAGSRAERMAAARSSFDRDVDAVRATITAAGGEVLDTVWLNRTVRGTLPAGGVAAVAADDAVAVVDLARRVDPDGQPATNEPSP
jgi:hypothetical protein